MPRIAVSYTDTSQRQEAEKLAAQLDCPLIENGSLAHFDYVLVYTSEKLALHKPSEKKFTLFYIDFLSKTILYRVRKASLRNELLARAMGKRPEDKPVIVDATAGLGRDSFLLASLGFQVIMLEQSPILHALLLNALYRAQSHPHTAEIAARMQLIQANSTEWLTGKQVDIVYLDPMFPERQKSASCKKEMVILQNLLGKEDKNQNLFDAAFACAKWRVVVKRPRLAEYVTPLAPHFSLLGKSSRFDIYLRYI